MLSGIRIGNEMPRIENGIVIVALIVGCDVPRFNSPVAGTLAGGWHCQPEGGRDPANAIATVSNGS